MKYDQMTSTNLPWVESPFFKELLPLKCGNHQETELAEFYHENGFVILRKVVDDELADRVRRETYGLFRPAIVEGPRCANRVYAGWKESSAVRELAALPEVIDTLRLLYGRKPIPFHTVDFLHGSQRRAHCDCIHYSSLPPRFLCAAWVALEDITPESGPLFYYPGSHKMPEYSLHDLGIPFGKLDYGKYEEFLESLARSSGFRKEIFLARKGDVMLWASNLIHGGEEIRRPDTTRWSQITHYYFQDCLYYTPLHSNLLIGELQHHEIRDVTTGAFVNQTYNGKPFSAIPTGVGRYRITERFRLLGWLISRIRRAYLNLRRRVFVEPGGYRE